MKKHIKILAFLILFILITIAAFIIYKSNSTKNRENESHEVAGLGTGGSDEVEFYGWKEKLDIKTLELINTVFKENFAFVYNANGEYIISLQEIKDKYYVGFEYLNTSTIQCDLSSSKFIAYVEDGIPYRSLNLNCKNLDE
ncbi:MAG: hypothetical protein IJO63_03670 [Bacilli bacterium]|nr:hypothetical protein [Bacilli bacterium]